MTTKEKAKQELMESLIEKEMASLSEEQRQSAADIGIIFNSYNFSLIEGTAVLCSILRVTDKFVSIARSENE